MRLTKRDSETQQAYETCKPNSLGNLHQRMRAVMALAETGQLHSTNPDLWRALCDLQTEVRYTVPADPPYARRTARMQGDR